MRTNPAATILSISISLGVFGAANAADTKPHAATPPTGGALTKQDVRTPSGSNVDGAAKAAGAEKAAEAERGKGVLYGWSDKDRMSDYEESRKSLQSALRSVESRDGYREALNENGYRITAIQSDTPSELVYEVVGDGNTYEVSMEFDDQAGKATDIHVADNMWRTEETRRAMKDYDYRPDTTGVLYNKDRADVTRDSNRMASWTEEKVSLEKMLEPGLPVAEYRNKLQEAGYQITSVNERDAEEVELEVVKGDQTYEIQMEREGKDQNVSAIEVNANLWHSDKTEAALESE